MSKKNRTSKSNNSQNSQNNKNQANNNNKSNNNLAHECSRDNCTNCRNNQANEL